ncbi:MAG: hypothetical protein HDT15_08850 [Oscillibacter sp.]|nr:hypothetical protein [Oscillibacter sp.]
MQERIKPTRSGLFAIELLIAVGIFSMCAAICVGLFVRSEVMSQDSASLNRAVSEARNVAECFKAAGGDVKKTAELIGGQIPADYELYHYFNLYFDKNWNRVSSFSEIMGGKGGYVLHLDQTQAYSSYTDAVVEVFRVDGRENYADVYILSWDIAALEVAS